VNLIIKWGNDSLKCKIFYNNLLKFDIRLHCFYKFRKKINFKIKLHLIILNSWAAVAQSDWLGTGGSGDRNPVQATFSAPVQTGPEAQPAFCTMGAGSFPGVKSGRRVRLTPHPYWCRGEKRIEPYLY